MVKASSTHIWILSAILFLSSCGNDGLDTGAGSNLDTASLQEVQETGFGTTRYGDYTTRFKDNGHSNVFEFDPSQPQTLISELGTILIIPRNTIVDKDHQPIKGKVKVYVQECYQRFDLMLKTIYNKSYFTTGIVHIEARGLDSNLLHISTDNTIRVRIPQHYDHGFMYGFHVYAGKRDANPEQWEENIVWHEELDLAKTMVPLPIDVLSQEPEFSDKYMEDDFEWTRYGITTDTVKYKYWLYYGELRDFKDTYLATEEFIDRSHRLATDGKDLMAIYANNVDKNLWEVDQMIVDYYYQDSVEQMNELLDNPPNGANGGPPSKEQLEEYDSKLYRVAYNTNGRMGTFRYRVSLGLTKVDTSKRINISSMEELPYPYVDCDIEEFGWLSAGFYERELPLSPAWELEYHKRYLDENLDRKNAN